MSGWATPVRTWADGDEPTGADFNAEIRDRMNALITSCHVYSTSTAVLSASAEVAFDGATRDPRGMWSSGLPKRITVPIAGKYRVRCRAGGVGSGNWFIFLKVNGSNVNNCNPGTSFLDCGPLDVTLNAGDYLEHHMERQAGTWTFGAFFGGVTIDMEAEWMAP